MPTGLHTSALSLRIGFALEAARDRTLRALAPLSHEDLTMQPTPILSPLVWDLAHIGHQEELWLLRTLHDERPTERRFDDIYNACEHERSERSELGLLDPAEAYEYVAHVRERVFRRLPGERFPDEEPLRRGGYVYHMVIQHEHQHNETMLQAFQIREDLVHPLAELWRPARVEGRASAVTLDAREFTMGSDDVGWAYDNEQPAHVRRVGAYAIDSHPVTNGEYARFVAEGAEPPMYWRRGGRRMVAGAVRACRAAAGRRARAAHLVPRGRGVCALGGCAASDRGRVGTGGSAPVVRRAGVGVDVLELRAVSRLPRVPV
jgi:iron(II)-dependent oxidoreductase